MDNLYIVIPTYNEEENIINVAKEWHQIVEKISKESRLLIIDGESKDNTFSILNSLKEDLPQLVVVTKPKIGHGATILWGYDYALKQGADYIFQTDSDGQTLASEFWAFWELRTDFSAIIGYRNYRKDGISRIFVTKTLKFVLWCVFKLNIPDANTPFRLMKNDVLKKHIAKIPDNFNLSNVALTVFLVKYKENIKFMPITFRQRQGGVNSINLRKIIQIGLQAVKDFRDIKKKLN